MHKDIGFVRNSLVMLPHHARAAPRESRLLQLSLFYNFFEKLKLLESKEKTYMEKFWERTIYLGEGCQNHPCWGPYNVPFHIARLLDSLIFLQKAGVCSDCISLCLCLSSPWSQACRSPCTNFYHLFAAIFQCFTVFFSVIIFILHGCLCSYCHALSVFILLAACFQLLRYSLWLCIAVQSFDLWLSVLSWMLCKSLIPLTFTTFPQHSRKHGQSTLLHSSRAIHGRYQGAVWKVWCRSGAGMPLPPLVSREPTCRPALTPTAAAGCSMWDQD